MASLVAHRFDLFCLLLLFFLPISKQAHLAFEELLWIGQVLPKQFLENTGLVVIPGIINIRSCESTQCICTLTEIHPTSSNYLLIELVDSG